MFSKSISRTTRRFLSDEEGAVTVDWVVLTAAVVGLGVAVLGVVSGGTQNLSSDIAAQLSGQGTNVPGWSGNGTSTTSGGKTGSTATKVTGASSTSGSTSSSGNKKPKVITGSTTAINIQFNDF